jgi:hypothetical protein
VEEMGAPHWVKSPISMADFMVEEEEEEEDSGAIFAS